MMHADTTRGHWCEVTVGRGDAVIIDVYGGSLEAREALIARLARAVERRTPFAVDDRYLEIRITPQGAGGLEAALGAADAALRDVGLR